MRSAPAGIYSVHVLCLHVGNENVFPRVSVFLSSVPPPFLRSAVLCVLLRNSGRIAPQSVNTTLNLLKLLP